MFDDRERNRDCDRFFPRYIILGPTGPTHTLISESKIYFYRHFFNIMA